MAPFASASWRKLDRHERACRRRLEWTWARVEGAVERRRWSVVGRRRNGHRPEVAGPQGVAGEVEHGVRGGDDEAGGEGERGVGAVAAHAGRRLRRRCGWGWWTRSVRRAIGPRVPRTGRLRARRRSCSARSRAAATAASVGRRRPATARAGNDMREDVFLGSSSGRWQPAGFEPRAAGGLRPMFEQVSRQLGRALCAAENPAGCHRPYVWFASARIGDASCAVGTRPVATGSTCRARSWRPVQNEPNGNMRGLHRIHRQSDRPGKPSLGAHHLPSAYKLFWRRWQAGVQIRATPLAGVSRRRVRAKRPGLGP